MVRERRILIQPSTFQNDSSFDPLHHQKASGRLQRANTTSLAGLLRKPHAELKNQLSLTRHILQPGSRRALISVVG